MTKMRNPETKIIRSTKGKFNPAVYLGKPRIYRPVAGAPRVSRLFVWNEELKLYQTPESSKAYMARRYEPNQNGTLQRKTHFFETLDGARKWQAGVAEVYEAADQVRKEVRIQSGPPVRALIEEWKRRIFPTLAQGTCLQYEKLIRLSMGSLLDLPVHGVTPQKIDEWLDELKARAKRSPRSRKSFDHELGLLSIILKYYLNYHDDPAFQFPVKKRHRDAVWLRKAGDAKAVSKDLSVEEFQKFREALLRFPRGRFFAALATVQYFQALRISEAAAIHWGDVRLDFDQSARSRLFVRRSVLWPRRKGLASFVQMGFKNSKSTDGVKEQPLFPESFAALQAMAEEAQGLGKELQGLVFEVDGKHLEYRSIQFVYDRAFKSVGLPYRGTHVMRHGGCRNIYNEVPDTAIAQQLLGNSSLQTTLIYAKRHASALTRVAEQHWERAEVNGGGCNWLQNTEPKLKLVKK